MPGFFSSSTKFLCPGYPVANNDLSCQIVIMIVTVTDFGFEGPYLGQMKAVLYREAPQVPVIDLFADLPPFDPYGAAYLLAAYAAEWPAGTVFLAVIDPGVGSQRRAAAVLVDGRWYVGPDNGLFNIVARRGRNVHWWDIAWQPARLSASFHGRDLFAPVAARLSLGEKPPGIEVDPSVRCDKDWPDDLQRVLYFDRYGNAITGLRASVLSVDACLIIAGHELRWANTFSDVPIGKGFWYENANGLAEIAVNQGRADRDLNIRLGDEFGVA